MLINDNNAEKTIDKDNIITWRQQLKVGFAALKAEFSQHPNTSRIFKQHCKLTDNLLSAIWTQSHINNHCCLIAVGGYGRGELYPYSDIDLLILVPESSLENTSNLDSTTTHVEAFVGLLWDIGLNVGHSVRTLSECIEESKKDITVQTNLIESRLLTGEVKLYQEFLNQINHTMDATSFFVAKLKEQDNRHAKFNDTAYNLEPNIKESPGGLRDLHMLMWITQSLNMRKATQGLNDRTWALLVKQNIITALEARQIQHHQKILQSLRIRLHFLSNRREDRLLFGR